MVLDGGWEVLGKEMGFEAGNFSGEAMEPVD